MDFILYNKKYFGRLGEPAALKIAGNFSLICLALLLFLVFSCAGTPKTPPKTPVAAVTPATKPAKPPKNLSFIEKVSACIDKNDYDGAIALFSTLTPEEAEKTRNVVLKASILISADRLAEAGEGLRAFLQKPGLPLADQNEAKFILSKVYGIEGNGAEQRKLLNSIVKADPSNIRALNELGNLDLGAKNYKSAGRYFDSALKLDNKNLDAMIGSASVLRLQDKPEDAIALLNNALALYPYDADALELRGRLNREAGNYQAALDDFDSVLKIDNYNYWALYDKGRTLLDMDKKAEALAEFEKAERIEPDNFVSYIYSAGIRDDLNDWKNALKDYETLSSLKPDYYFANEMLGVHLMRDKQYIKAEEAFMTAYFTAKQETDYALLAVVNALYGGVQLQKLKPFLELAMKKVDRSKIDYYALRLFYDFSGDSDFARRVAQEKNPREKAKYLFYLALFYDIKGNRALAEKYLDEFKTYDRKDLIEWRINDWIMENRSFNAPKTAAVKN